uniref:PAZ domain-containing protein n=2 Tax=Aegilops tauschii subsp. strangulata TaxID=200361 RepID=A0A453EPU0_AEGTS
MPVVQYFKDIYNCNLQYTTWPCLQSGSDYRPVYLPMEISLGNFMSGCLHKLLEYFQPHQCPAPLVTIWTATTSSAQAIDPFADDESTSGALQKLPA